MAALTIVQEDSSDTGQCDCCGMSSRSVWGWAEEGDSVVAAYMVHWTLGAVPKHGAHFDILLGDWGEGSGPGGRSAVALEYQLAENGPFFSIINAAGRNAARLCAKAWSRDEVVGTLTATRVFEVADAVLAQDKRVKELLGEWQVV